LSAKNQLWRYVRDASGRTFNAVSPLARPRLSRVIWGLPKTFTRSPIRR
jgi:hypothetical protein